MSNPKGINQYTGLSPAQIKLAKMHARVAKADKARRDGVVKPKKPKRFKTTYGWAGGGGNY